MKKTTKTLRYVLVGNTTYGLYVGQTDASDKEIIATKAVRLVGGRHVCRWFGRTGGITSLAAFGPCGPKAADSRIGAPCDGLVTGIVNVFDLTPEAVEAFGAIEATIEAS